VSTPQAAALLRTSGYALCKPDPSEKKPTYKGWPTRSLEPTDFANGEMLGVMGGPLSNGGWPGQALVILDLDSADAVRLGNEYLPPTGMVEGRPGKPRSHRYYLVPTATIPEWATSKADQSASAAKQATGHAGPFLKHFKHRGTGKGVLDFIGTGGQVVCPPSPHPSGEVREWDGGTPSTPAVIEFLELWRATGELASACGAEIPDVIPRPPKGRERRPPVPTLDRARAYLAKMPPAVSGEGGHNAAFAAARAMVWGFDLGVDVGFELLRDEYNPRCEPHWSETELRHKSEDADRVPYGKDRGHLRDEHNPERNGKHTGKSATGGGEDEPSGEAKKDKPPSVAELLAGIGLALDLWHDSNQTGFATIGRLSHPIRSKAFKHHLVNEYRKRHGGKVPGAEALGNAITTIEAAAIHDGPERTAFVRVGEADGRVYLFLADRASTVIEIDAAGWRSCDNPPVRFRKPAGMLPLSMPERGGNLDDLRPFINVIDDATFALVKAWAANCLRPSGHFPLMVSNGEQGSAKTTAGKVLKRLIDPSTAPARSEPRDEHTLMIQARNNWLLLFDNLSHLPPWLSDALCRLALGGGFSTRELYTTDEEVIFNAKRPVMTNGIEEFITRGDLLERSLIFRHPPIPEKKRRPESEFWAAFDDACPKLLGALLDRVSGGLRELPGVKPDGYPRMADFALFALACEKGSGEKPQFLDAYTDNQAGSHAQVLDDSPLTPALVSLMQERESWSGSSSALLAELEKHTTNPLPKDWPKKPNALTGRLRRLAPNLRRVHRLNVDCDGRSPDRKRGRVVTITAQPESVGERSSEPSAPSTAGTFARKTQVTCGRCADGTGEVVDDPPTPRPTAQQPRKPHTADDADGADDLSHAVSDRFDTEDDAERWERDGIAEFGGG
jgi:hypothetical protein